VSWHVWQKRWRLAYDACCALGLRAKANSSPPTIEPPASEPEVAAVEGRLGVRLPAAFRDTLLHFSRRVSFSWYCDPDDCKILGPPEAVRSVVAGRCHWDLGLLEKLDLVRRGWADTFSDPNRPFDQVWQRKVVAIQQDGYGNLLALDARPDGGDAVVYLSHDDDAAHGYHLGRDFLDFMDRWSQVGCAGPYAGGWLPFTRGPQSLIDPDCENARTWRKWFGLEERVGDDELGAAADRPRD
jgi:hypothetical protein